MFILDVPDLKTSEESEKIRKRGLTPGEYEKKYKDLKHTYYPKEFFTEFATEFGFQCEIFPSFIPNYRQAEHRFSVLLNF